MRRFVIAASAIAIALLALAHSDSVARPASRVTIHVSSTQADKPVEFGVRYFGGSDEPGGRKDHLSAPFDVVIRGDEAYALFRQTGGTGTMRLDVRKGPSGAASAMGPIGMVIVTPEKLGVAGFER